MKVLLFAGSLAIAPTSAAAASACLHSQQTLSLSSHAAPTLLTITVLPDGSVKSATVAESSGNSELDKAASACVLTWHYKPFSDKPEATTQARIDWQFGHP